MGMESIIYGIIKGPHWPHKIQHVDVPDAGLNPQQGRYREIDRKLREKVLTNLEVIAVLPEKDEWPFLSRTLFSVKENHTIQNTYRSQIITFGGSFKGIESDWEAWLAKFEDLLRKMYWETVYLHLLSEQLGFSHFEYSWQCEDGAYLPNATKPVEKWTFSGGPRRYEDFFE